MSSTERGGPLAGLRVLEVQGLGPGPFCAGLLSDFGAEVIRVDRVQNVTGEDGPPPPDVLSRGRRSIGIDLKSPAGVALLLRLAEQADVLIEGFRPGVMERLGVGPDVCLARNPRLIYGRITGWGREGAYAAYAGHDINYLALSGTLWSIGRDGQAPVPPLTYVGDFGGGGMFLALGICAALAERAGSGRGQVVDTAMVDGAAVLHGFLYGMRAGGMWSTERGTNLLDSGAPFYDVYETSDGRWVSVGAIEPQFYRNLLKALDLTDIAVEDQNDETRWPAVKARLAAVFKTRTRDRWCELLEGAEACFAPVLSPWEAPDHPHNRQRGTYTEVAGLVQPGPAPRFGRTPGAVAGPAPHPGQHTDEVLLEWGLGAGEIAALRADGDIA
ncbi:CaiB/BaiF CoA transferase family protein [Nocardia sp. alder85J]|uniref:CaiB/BaiF CoA transferase family protein n=1 Tax=Nocardia sp. alder85J TaxID=2862949 RepID=UPI001CD6FB39|nr:CaiB/BaiF CoA-transferase family protein [Nocardia sp. alder85J]MCX4096832.1 CaiB/BaiF CoA-transferase family protein [Nocardia sp. alder85J]